METRKDCDGTCCINMRPGGDDGSGVSEHDFQLTGTLDGLTWLEGADQRNGEPPQMVLARPDRKSQHIIKMV